MLSGKRLPKQSVGPNFASRLLRNEPQGFAIDATVENGRVSVKDPTLANNLYNVPLDSSNLTQSGTSPKMVLWNSSPYVRWTPHNLFLNSASPATQNVTLVTGLVYTYGITGAGSLAGSSGASGTATDGSPVTFTATGTTGTFTVTGSPSTMFINRGPALTPYLVTTAATRIGIPQEYDAAASKYGILAEPAATNLATYSEQFDNVIWSLTSSAISANNTTAPDGSSTADKFTASSGSNVHNIFINGGLVPGSVTTATSIFVKSSTAQYVHLANPSSSGNYIHATFDLTGVSVTQTGAAGTGTYSSSSITSIGNGWYRIILVGFSGAAGSNLSFHIVDSGTPTVGTFGNVTWTAAGTEAVWIWGAQSEVSNVATSYIPTLSSTVTRAADVPKALTSTFPWSDTNGSIYVKYKPRLVSSGSRYVWQAYKDANNHISLLGITADPTLENTQASTQDVALDAGTLVANTLTRISGAYKANDFDVSQDAAAVQSDSGATLTTGYTDLYIGTKGSATTEELNGYIYQLLYVPYQRQTVNGDIGTWKNTA